MFSSPARESLSAYAIVWSRAFVDVGLYIPFSVRACHCFDLDLDLYLHLVLLLSVVLLPFSFFYM
jgi:hypothetical protein